MKNVIKQAIKTSGCYNLGHMKNLSKCKINTRACNETISLLNMLVSNEEILLYFQSLVDE